MSFDAEWEEFRAESFEYMKERKETIFKEWLKVIGGKNVNIAYAFTYNNKLTIFSKHPGCLIGKAGANIEILKNMLKDEFYHDYEISFIEVEDFIISAGDNNYD